MDQMIFAYVSYFFQRNSRFLQILVEERGHFSGSERSVFGILVRSLDSGCSAQEIQEFYSEISRLEGHNIEFCSYYTQESSKIQCVENELSVEIVNKPNEYGSSFRFDFVLDHFFVLQFHEFLLQNYWEKHLFEFEPTSKFRDLRPYSLSYSLSSKIDFTDSILSTLTDFVDKTPQIQEVLLENFEIPSKNLPEILHDIFPSLPFSQNY